MLSENQLSTVREEIKKVIEECYQYGIEEPDWQSKPTCFFSGKGIDTVKYVLGQRLNIILWEKISVGSARTIPSDELAARLFRYNHDIFK